MKKIARVLAATVPVLFLVCSCAPNPGLQAPRYSDDGQVFAYLSSNKKHSQDISFTLSAIGFMDENGKWYDVMLHPLAISSGELSAGQIKLKEFYLPEGKYKKTRWVISEAGYLDQNKQYVRLNLPDQVHHKTTSGRVFVDSDFRIFSRESLCLFAQWDVDNSIEDKHLFAPKLTVEPQGMAIENVLAYVSNEASNCVTIIDRQEDEVVGTIAVGKAPRGITARRDRATVYVANSGSNDISVIDTSVNRVINRIGNLGNAPEDFAWSWNNNLLYVTNPHSNNVSVIDADSGMVISRINVGNRPTGIVADKDRQKIYVTNTDSLTISVIDTNTQTVDNTFTVSSSPRYMALCDDRLYVANETMDENIYVVELPEYSVSAISAGFSPGWLVCGLSNRVYVANAPGNEVSFLYTAAEMITRTIPVGHLPAGMAVDPIRRKLYVANSRSGNVSVIDVTAERWKKTIQTGNKPHAIALIEE